MYQEITAMPPGGTLFTASVTDAGGARQQLYRRGDGRLFVAGAPGTAYRLLVANVTSGRIEVLVSVDGRDIHADVPADLGTGTGLVIPANSTYTFKGYRVSNDVTREFVFGAVAGSVAEQAGDTSSTGVIGIAAYRELRPFRYPHDDPYLRGTYAGYDSGMPVASAAVAGIPGGSSASLRTNTADMATHAGREQDDKVSTTEFRRSGSPEVLAIGYASLAELEARGITGPADPDPFPGSKTGYERYTS